MGKANATYSTSLPYQNGGAQALMQEQTCVIHISQFVLSFCSSHKPMWPPNPHPRQTESYTCQTHYTGSTCLQTHLLSPDSEPCPTLQLPSGPYTDELFRSRSVGLILGCEVAPPKPQGSGI